MSPTIKIERRLRRSTHTPAGSVKRTNGANSTVPSAATSNVVAFSVRIATVGIAICETCEPNSLIDWPAQSLTKSPCRQRPSRGQSRTALLTTRGLGRIEADDEAVQLAVGGLAGAHLVDEALEP